MSPLNITCPHCFVKNRVPASRLVDAPNCGKCHQPLFAHHPVVVTSEQFGKMIEGTDIPVVVDFWATWCAPCKMFAPIYEQAAPQLEPRMRLLKLDTDENQDVSARLRIQSIPTLAIFKNGKEHTRQSGALTLGRFLEWANSNVS